ncbi:hypothetical protein J6590_093683 [Homalodisca vitripennis]|nr:hypothetical protein J6590_093683 [Homalodisca vitripennis]
MRHLENKITYRFECLRRTSVRPVTLPEEWRTPIVWFITRIRLLPSTSKKTAGRCSLKAVATLGKHMPNAGGSTRANFTYISICSSVCAEISTHVLEKHRGDVLIPMSHRRTTILLPKCVTAALAAGNAIREAESIVHWTFRPIPNIQPLVVGTLGLAVCLSEITDTAQHTFSNLSLRSLPRTSLKLCSNKRKPGTVWTTMSSLYFRRKRSTSIGFNSLIPPTRQVQWRNLTGLAS